MIKRVFKSWGYEDWIVNNELYCGKILHIDKNHCCSYHYHKIKDETFYILNGEVFMELNGEKSYMVTGDFIRIKPGDQHRFFGIEESNIIEISTQHFDSDSYRLLKSDHCDEIIAG